MRKGAGSAVTRPYCAQTGFVELKVGFAEGEVVFVYRDFLGASGEGE